MQLFRNLDIRLAAVSPGEQAARPRLTSSSQAIAICFMGHHLCREISYSPVDAMTGVAAAYDWAATLSNKTL